MTSVAGIPLFGHSPGPWRVGDHCQVHRSTPHGDLRVVCEVWSGPCDSIEEAQANERLIAAAPDLLQLARVYATECGECAGTRITPDDRPCEECADIWRVIDRAEGRS